MGVAVKKEKNPAEVGKNRAENGEGGGGVEN
jgi:hypothetical protein